MLHGLNKSNITPMNMIADRPEKKRPSFGGLCLSLLMVAAHQQNLASWEIANSGILAKFFIKSSVLFCILM
jgi:hypothetical protein